MTWDNFVVLWSTEIDSTIPKESVFQWQDFVDKADNQLLIEAVKNIAEKYFGNVEKGSNKKPVLSQLVAAYNVLKNEKKLATAHPGCDFCDHDASGMVYVIDNSPGGMDNFPPDPATWQGRRNVCVVPCPCCRANEYADQGVRDRVLHYSRPFARRNELYSKAVITA